MSSDSEAPGGSVEMASPRSDSKFLHFWSSMEEGQSAARINLVCLEAEHANVVRVATQAQRCVRLYVCVCVCAAQTVSMCAAFSRPLKISAEHGEMTEGGKIRGTLRWERERENPMLLFQSGVVLLTGWFILPFMSQFPTPASISFILPPSSFWGRLVDGAF